MVGESIAILIVLGVAAIMAIRSGRRAVVKMTLPFCAVPFAYLLGEACFYPYRAGLRLPLQTWRVLFVVLGGAVGIIATFVVARLISSYIQNAKRLYIPFSLIFVVAITVAYCIRLLA